MCDQLCNHSDSFKMISRLLKLFLIPLVIVSAVILINLKIISIEILDDVFSRNLLSCDEVPKEQSRVKITQQVCVL